jgi:hypothetical protein
MAMKHNQLSMSMQAALEQLKEAQKLSESLVTEYDSSTFWPESKLVEQVKAYMGKPDWRMHATHEVKGVYQTKVIDVKFEIVFDMQIQKLQKQTSHSNNTLPAVIRSRLARTQSELDEIINDALLPHSFGVSTSVSILEWHHDGYPEKPRIPQETAIVELTLTEELINFDYSMLITAIIHEPRCERGAFEAAFRLPISLFDGKKPVDKTFHWHDANLTYSAQATFEPIG